jgi:cardiolipin synthase A/B
MFTEAQGVRSSTALATNEPADSSSPDASPPRTAEPPAPGTPLAPEARQSNGLARVASGVSLVRRTERDTLALRAAPVCTAWWSDMPANFEVVPNNEVDVLVDGAAFFAKANEDIVKARRFVHIVMYALGGSADDVVTRDLERLLLAKRAEGVEVRIKIDAHGSRNLMGFGPAAAMVNRLRAAGAEVMVNGHFNPESGCESPPASPFEHRKLVITDAPDDEGGGVVVHTGGMGVQDRYLDWHDVMFRIHGDAAHQAQSDFFRDWLRNGGRIPANGRTDDELHAHYFPEASVAGDVDLQALQNVPGFKNAIRDQLLADITAAEEFITIEITDPKIRAALIEAARKGRVVRVVVPQISDYPIATGVLRAKVYPELRAAGVQVFEYHGGRAPGPRMTHAKLFVTDKVAQFGSYNLDGMSRKNLELNYRTASAGVRAQVRAIVEADIVQSEVPRDATAMQKALGILLTPIVGPVL